MILTVDIGNTNICFAFHQEGHAAPVYFDRMPTDAGKPMNGFLEAVNGLLSSHGLTGKDIRKCALSSVVEEAGKKLTAALSTLLPCEVFVIRPTDPLPFAIHIDNPSELGADIVCDVAGAMTLVKPPFITVDMGTCTVVTAVSPKPAIEGVVICPGIRTGLNALFSQAEAIPDIRLEIPKAVVGKNTLDSVISGAVFGNASLVDGLIDRITEETGAVYQILVTGGLSGAIVPYLKHPVIADPDLLMKGLYDLTLRR